MEIMEKEKELNPFLSQIKQISKEKKINQVELAEKSKISINTIRGWFSKNLIPDVISGVKIANVLGESVEFLVTGIAQEISGLSQEEKALIEKFRKLKKENQNSIVDIINNLSIIS